MIPAKVNCNLLGCGTEPIKAWIELDLHCCCSDLEITRNQRSVTNQFSTLPLCFFFFSFLHPVLLYFCLSLCCSSVVCLCSFFVLFFFCIHLSGCFKISGLCSFSFVLYLTSRHPFSVLEKFAQAFFSITVSNLLVLNIWSSFLQIFFFTFEFYYLMAVFW